MKTHRDEEKKKQKTFFRVWLIMPRNSILINN